MANLGRFRKMLIHLIHLRRNKAIKEDDVMNFEDIGCRSIPLDIRCPFCSGHGAIIYYPAHELPRGQPPYYQCECSSCGATTKRCYTMTAAIRAWMRRPRWDHDSIVALSDIAAATTGADQDE